MARNQRRHPGRGLDREFQRDSVNAGLLRLRRMNVAPAGEGGKEFFGARGRHNSLKRLKTAKEIKGNQS